MNNRKVEGHAFQTRASMGQHEKRLKPFEGMSCDAHPRLKPWAMFKKVVPNRWWPTVVGYV